MGWDERRAGWHFICWRFGVGGVMIFVVVFVVVFAPEWKRGNGEREGEGGEREGKGRGREGEGRREEEGRQEKRRQERLHVYVRKGV